MAASSGLVLAEGPNLGAPLPLGDDECGLAKAPKEPKEPDNRFEKLLFLGDEVLDTVDCDQRFRFPTPSRTPLLLSGQLYAALDRLRGSGERFRSERFAGLKLMSFGLWDLRADALGRGPVRVDAARCTVTSEEEDAAFDRVDWRW